MEDWQMRLAEMFQVSDLGVVEWDFGFTVSLNAYDDIQVQTLKVLLRVTVFEPDKEDSILWIHSVDKLYSVAEAIQGGIPVKEVLSYRRRLRNGMDDKCVWCDVHIESIDHLLLHCSWSRNIWSALFNWRDVSWVMPSSVCNFSIDCFHGLGRKAKKAWRLIGPTTYWFIWIERNDLVFNDVRKPWPIIVDQVKLKVFQWLANANIVKGFQFYIWKEQPWLLI
ncbi:uncharacterized protein [Rutidosis leptorrhynchoides]|uniref:uncharacterized protein n=1 Tax=Rutidosis leptorrhynchoides TaxID=125765 RepID=UPI003A9999FF